MHSTPRVLIVESGDSIGRMVAIALHHEGYEVIRAQDPLEVSDRISVMKPDLVIFNTSMASLDKAKLIEEWRKLSPPTRMLDLSYGRWIPALATESGIPDAYETYPFRLESLVEKVGRLLQQETKRSDRDLVDSH
jgi:DNA-binding response OmpR family regulator